MKDPMEAVRRLVDGFNRNIRVLRGPDTLEATVRQEYIDQFWRALGWDVGNRAQRSHAEKDVIIEPSVETVEGGRTRKRRPDYLFRIDGFPKFVLEAKKPAVDLKTDRDSIFQAKAYAWNAQIPFAILTDFEEFRLFDATLKPDYGTPERGVVRDFDLKFERYADLWSVLAETFGREAVASGSLERLLAQIKKVRTGRRLRTADRMLIDLRGSEPVDRAFLSFLEGYRGRLARDIYQSNKAAFPEADTRHGAAKLTEAVQRLLDRLVFTRVCEDRDIIPYGDLRGTLDFASKEKLELYPLLVGRFRERNLQFNGYLFREHFSDGLAVSGELLAEFIRALYPPESPYRLDAIGDDILGIVYERFLGNVVSLRRGQVVIEEKPEVRHAGGVYYTPRYVVDTIVRRVVGPKVEGLTPQEVLKVKVLDPACGSGSFLVAAYQYLIDHCIRYVSRHPDAAHIPASKRARKKTKDIAFQSGEEWHLAPDFRAELLTSCVHGVDIDAQAVEVTMMSLYLKMLEDPLPPGWQRTWVEDRLLPPLDTNVRCGNSLISPDDFDRWWDDTQGGLFSGDADTKFRINAFEWRSPTLGFGRLIGADGGFDCILGNPPYIRVQELNAWAPEECEFYKWRYKTAAAGNFDIYIVFTERALRLLDRSGLLGFIMPHKFWQATYGTALRKLIAETRNLRSVVNFGHQQVFADATTYTAIHILQKRPNDERVDYARFDELGDGHRQCIALDSGRTPEGVKRLSAEHPGPGRWSFVDPATSVAPRMRTISTLPLKEVARLAQGIKTSCDPVYVLEVVERHKQHTRVRSPQTEKEHDIESSVLRPLIKSENMRRFEVVPTSRVLLFPYRVGEDAVELLPEKWLRAEAPRAWAYLKEVEEVLRQRERGRMRERPDWYGYIYPKNFVVLSKPKLVIPDISEHMRVGPDASGEYMFSGGGAGGNAIVAQDTSTMWYLLGLLNSRAVEAYLRETGTQFRGGYLNCEIRFLRDIPVPDRSTPAVQGTAVRIASHARAIVEAKRGLRREDGSSRERQAHERAVESHERHIERAVLDLYGLSAADIPDFNSSG